MAGEKQPDPATIESEIERTRAELADTIDMIAEKMSPKRAVVRTADRVKAAVKGSDNRARVDLDVPETGERVTMVANADTAAPMLGMPETAVDAGALYQQQTGLPGGAVGEGHLYTVQRTLRIDRVLLAAGGALAIATIVVVFLRRRRD